jgi:hypothetical protein
MVLVALIAVVLAMAPQASASASAKPLRPAPPRHGAHGSLALAPSAALPGGTVLITGKGLGGRRASVTIAGLTAAVQTATGKRLVVEVPAAAPSGTTTLVVRRHDGRTLSAPFQVLGEEVFDGVADLLTNTPAKVTQTIGTDGGRIVAGAVIMDIPPGALLTATTITVTPLSGIAGTPVDDAFQSGALLAPEGLRFLQPATLTLPATTDAGLAAFGSAGDGTHFHAIPSVSAGGVVTIPIWHFSAAGAIAPDASQWTAVLNYLTTSAEEQATQAAAAAAYAGNTQGIIDALRAWYVTSVKTGLQVAVGASQEFFELAVGEFMAGWYRVVSLFGVEDALQTEKSEGERLALDAAADLAGRLLSRCTPTGDLTDMLQDVLRLAAIAQLDPVMFALETRQVDGRTLPDADSLPGGCVSAKVESLTLPAVLAKSFDNPLTVHAGTEFWNGGVSHERLLRVEIRTTGSPQSLEQSDVTSTGTWETTVSPQELGPFGRSVRARLDSGASDSVLDALDDSRPLSAPVRQRLELLAQPPSGGDFGTALPEVAPGSTVHFRARLAGPDVVGRALTYGFTGAGTVSPTSGSTTSLGTADFDYTVPMTAGATGTVRVSLLDGTVLRTATMQVAVRPAGVTISPRPLTLTIGTPTTFTATLTGAPSGTAVTWSATGGTVSSSGVFTPDTLGSATVTATAVGASDTVSFTVVPNVVVSIAPTSATVAPTATQQFTATVTGTINTAITWSATGGTVSSEGLFTAGAGPSGTVTATSAADPMKSATAVVTIAEPFSRVDLMSVNVGAGGHAGIAGESESLASDCDTPSIGGFNVSFQDPLSAGRTGSGSCHTTSTNVPDHSQVSADVTYVVAKDDNGSVTGFTAFGSWDAAAFGRLAQVSDSAAAKFTVRVTGTRQLTYTASASIASDIADECASNGTLLGRLILTATGQPTSRAFDNGEAVQNVTATVSGTRDFEINTSGFTSGGPSTECTRHVEFELHATFS